MKHVVSMAEPYSSEVPVASSLPSGPFHYLHVVGDVCSLCDRTTEITEREHFAAISSQRGEKLGAKKRAKAEPAEEAAVRAGAGRVCGESARAPESLQEQRDTLLLRRETDEDVLARIARSDSAAVREMVARKLPALLALATRILGDRTEAEDVTQEAFLRIWQQAPNWETGRARFDTWLYAVASNLCRDRLRRRRELYAAEPPETADPNSAPDRGLQAKDNAVTVECALAMLPDRQREVVVLQYYEQLSNIKAAAVMGISVEALESLLARARRNLRAYLENADACR